jgi:hypothetical protein
MLPVNGKINRLPNKRLLNYGSIKGKLNKLMCFFFIVSTEIPTPWKPQILKVV